MRRSTHIEAQKEVRAWVNSLIRVFSVRYGFGLIGEPTSGDLARSHDIVCPACGVAAHQVHRSGRRRVVAVQVSKHVRTTPHVISDELRFDSHDASVKWIVVAITISGASSKQLAHNRRESRRAQDIQRPTDEFVKYMRRSEEKEAFPDPQQRGGADETRNSASFNRVKRAHAGADPSVKTFDPFESSAGCSFRSRHFYGDSPCRRLLSVRTSPL